MSSRVERLREFFAEQEVDAFVCSSPANRLYLTGFTGSAGTVVVGRAKAYFLTDFRYVEQAKAQAPGFNVVHYQDPFESLSEVLKELEAQEGRVRIRARHRGVDEPNRGKDKRRHVGTRPRVG